MHIHSDRKKVTEEPLSCSHKAETARQAARYLQASILGTLCNFAARIVFSLWFGFGTSVVLANYVGMAIVFRLSYRRAFAAGKATIPMMLRFAFVAHLGLLVVWAVSIASLYAMNKGLSAFWAHIPLDIIPETLLVLLPELLEAFCHGVGIVSGFTVNFFGHKCFSFAKRFQNESA